MLNKCIVFFISLYQAGLFWNVPSLCMEDYCSHCDDYQGATNKKSKKIELLVLLTLKWANVFLDLDKMGLI